MEPATLTFRSLDGTTDAVLTSPEFAARLLGDGRPPIAASFDGELVTFTADTFDLVLKERVATILCDVFGEEWHQHVHVM